MSLNHPLAQLEAAEEFCEAICAFVQDEWENMRDDNPPDVEEIHSTNVLDLLARLGLRFEIASDDDVGCDAYFAIKPSGSPIDRVLYGFARRVAEGLREDFLPDLSLKLVMEIVTIHGCLLDNFIFVNDDDAVTSEAYMMLLKAPTTPIDEESGLPVEGKPS
jgi:hypothetical protein